MLCLSPFSEDKPHARFFFFQCSVHPADCAAGRAAAGSLRAARPGGVSAVFRAGVRSGAPARRAGAALHLRRAAVVCGCGAEYADIRAHRARLALPRHAAGRGAALSARGRTVFRRGRAAPVRADARRRARVSRRAAAPGGLCARSVAAVCLALAGGSPLRAEPRRLHPSGRADRPLLPRRAAAQALFPRRRGARPDPRAARRARPDQRRLRQAQAAALPRAALLEPRRAARQAGARGA